MISLLILLATAGTPPSDCQSPPPLPAELAAWSSQSPEASGGQLAIGTPRVVQLEAAPLMQWAHRPERAPAQDSHGAALSFPAVEAGVYRIALSDAAWIDVVGPSGLIPSGGTAMVPNAPESASS